MFVKKNVIFFIFFALITLIVGCTMLPSPQPTTYTITSSAGEGGTISPLGDTLVTEGASQSFTITTDEGYEVSDVLVDGESAGVVSTYTFSSVQQNHTISVSFTQETQPPAPAVSTPRYTITATAGTGGSIDPEGSVKVTKGKDKTFTITPLSPCYEIEDVLVDGVSEGAIDTYTFTNIQANHTIEVIFDSPVSKATNIDTGVDSCSIQTAIDNASDGDTIIVCPGTYYENITIAKNITLRSVDPLDWDIVADTIIDGTATDTVVTFTAGGYEPILRGFTITNGYQYEGGGISMEDSSPTIEYNIITENHSDDYGGGIYMYDNCNPYIRYNKIIKNLADDVGGGIYMTYECNPTIKYNYIEENEVEDGDGGGIYMKNDSGDDTIIPNISYNYIRYNDADDDGGGIAIEGNCNPTIEHNIITNNISNGSGGGISVDDYSEPTIRYNDILDNYVNGSGGGISVYGSSPLIEYNTINDNDAQQHGGGISVEWATTQETAPTIKDNTINDNEAIDGSGGGIYACKFSAYLLPDDARPTGWGDTRENIPPYDNLPIAGNEFSGNIHDGLANDGAHVYFDE